MKRTLCAWLLTLGLAVGTALPASAAPFSDVASDAWYAPAVGEVSDAGVMNGTTDTTFSPDEQVTRGMVVTVLWRLAGSPAASASVTFPDVEDWYYYAPAVAWAQAAGVAAGLGDGTFGGGILNGGTGIRILPEGIPALGMILPVGGFLTLACVIAAMQYFLNKPKKNADTKEEVAK